MLAISQLQPPFFLASHPITPCVCSRLSLVVDSADPFNCSVLRAQQSDSFISDALQIFTCAPTDPFPGPISIKSSSEWLAGRGANGGLAFVIYTARYLKLVLVLMLNSFLGNLNRWISFVL